MKSKISALAALALLLFSTQVDAQTTMNPPILPIGGANMSGWTGVERASDNGSISAPGRATFSYPKGPKGWYVVGFRNENDCTRDWRKYCGIQLKVYIPSGGAVRLEATIKTPPPALRQEYLPQSKASVAIAGHGWQTVTLPWSSFDFDPNQIAFLKFVQQIEIQAQYADGKPGEVRIKDVRLIMAPVVSLQADVKGKSALPGETVTYNVAVGNCTDTPQEIDLKFAANQWRAMPATVSPSHLHIAPGGAKSVNVSVAIPADGVPEGGHETQTLQAIAAGNAAPISTLDLVTARDVGRPSILLTAAGWADVRQKVKDYAWAKQGADDYIKAADEWEVPLQSMPPNNYSVAEKHAFVFPVANFDKAQKCAVAWQLTRDKKYADKVALFLTRLADPVHGYPSTFACVDQGGPQEGGDFQSVAIAYDEILDSGALSTADKASIERTFRLYMETFEEDLTVGNVGNWTVAQSTACLFSALAMGDLSAADRYIDGPGGFKEFVGKGIMDDGWWWECSTGYNNWVASELTQEALACKPWGIDLLNLEVPANFSPHTITNPWALDPPYGVSFEKWGPNYRNTRSVKQIWDSLPEAVDYRGNIFGTNDGHEEFVGGARMELAYYSFRDPAYAALIKLGNSRDLIYGIPDLPNDPDKPYVKSGYAENIGYTLLRSQADNRTTGEQIQAVLKTGTQGGFHGHFDRASLIQISRYGRDFWTPESIWWGYPNYMYKFYVQTSLNSNMVVVDDQQQEAVPSKQTLFFSGKMMQVGTVETDARWSDPPYGGMQYFPGDTFASQMQKNSQSVPLATDRKYGELGPYSERIMQRRLAIVTDDYVVIADYLKGSEPHTFDNLFQIKEFSGIDAEVKQDMGHKAQMSDDPHSSAQFITDCEQYQVSAPAVAHSAYRYGPGATNQTGTEPYNTDGILKLDIHTLWPQSQQIVVGTVPQMPQTSQQWVSYDVAADGKSLAHGESGMWILGQANIDVPVNSAQTLTLTISSKNAKKKALFWAGAHVLTADGKSIPLSQIASFVNAAPAPAGQDYYGGTVKIAGTPYSSAIATQPINPSQPAVITISLAGLNAARFQAVLGADYPIGDESQARKVLAVRTTGSEARFLTVLEPFESQAMVKSAVATDADTLQVTLADGRVQDVKISNLDGDGKHISVSITESQGGKMVRTEQTPPNSE